MSPARARKFGPKNGATYLSRARAAWSPLPDWVEKLARAADALPSQGVLARKLGCSASAVSAVISNAYKGGLARIEKRVRGALMAETVGCPVLGEIASNDCATNQRAKFSAANPVRAQLARACKTCPNALNGG